MDEFNITKAVSLTKVLKNIFSYDEIKDINVVINQLDNIEEASIPKVELTDNIKCYLLISQYLSNHNKLYSSTTHGMIECAGSDGFKTNMQEFLLSGYPTLVNGGDENYVNEDTESNNEIWEYFKNEDFRTRFKLSFCGTIEERNLLDKFCDLDFQQLLQGDQSSIDESIVNLLLLPSFQSTYSLLVGHDTMKEIFETPNEVFNLHNEIIEISKSVYIYNLYISKYRLIKLRTGNMSFEDILLYFAAGVSIQEDVQLSELNNVLNYFHLYEATCNANIKTTIINFVETQFEDDIDEYNCFIDFLNLGVEDGGSPFVDVFCDEIENHYSETGKKSPIDFSFLTSRIIPQFDSNEEHTEWFKQIPSCKYNSGTYNILYRNLSRLHQKLIGDDKIECGKDLFVYRFSGLGDIPYSPKITISWKGTNRELGFLILGLYHYYDKKVDKIISPLYSDIQKYFGVEGNLKSVGQKWINNKTWMKTKVMLEECGFSNVDVVEDE